MTYWLLVIVFQVKLTEHIKLQDNIFEVQNGHTLQESLHHQRTVTFQVQFSYIANKVEKRTKDLTFTRYTCKGLLGNTWRILAHHSWRDKWSSELF